MRKRVYVGNLAGTTDTTGLEILFSTIGNVETASIVSGFGIVDMSTETEAVNCVEYFNGQEHDGNLLRVSQVAPQPRRPVAPALFRRRSG